MRLAQEKERPAEDVGDQVRVAVRAFVHGLQPVGVVLRMARDERVLGGERRVADESVEAAVRTVEHPGELERPVERRDREVGGDRSEPLALVRTGQLDGRLNVGAQMLTLLGLGALEERGDHGVAHELGVAELGLDAVQDRAEVVLAGVLDRLADAPALGLHPDQAIAHPGGG